MSSNSNSRWETIAKILAAVAACVAIIAYVTGRDSFPAFFNAPTPIVIMVQSGPATALPPTAVRLRETRIVLPRCNCEETVASDEPVVARLRWGATSQELAEQGANLVSYNLRVDGTVAQALGKYRKPAVFVPDKAATNGEKALWWVYWDYPLGTLPLGSHVVEFTVVATADVYDGTTTMGAGTEITSRVTLQVVPPSTR